MTSAWSQSSSDSTTDELLNLGPIAQQWDIHADANGFMCPFLTPMFIEQIQDRWGGVVTSHEPKDSRVVAWIPEEAVGPEEILDYLAVLGFQPKLIHWTISDSIDVAALQSFERWAP